MLTSTVAVNDAVNAIPSRTTVPKPVSVNVTLYAPGTNAMIRYCPWLSVKTVRVFSMSAGLDASTATPGITSAARVAYHSGDLSILRGGQRRDKRECQ